MSAPPIDPERHALESQLAEERFNDLLKLTADWLWEQDADLRFSWFSSNYSQGGADHKTYLGAKRWDLPLDLPEAAMAAHRALLEARQPFRDLEYRITTADGKQRWYVISGLPLFAQGVFVGYRGTGREITHRKQLEAELRLHRDHLAELVKAQTADLQRAKDAAERANLAKSEFLTNMSHEFRTPLHAMLAFARLGHLRAGKTDTTKLREYFDLIRGSGKHLLELVDELLDLSKLEAGNARLTITEVDLHQHAATVIKGLSALLESRNMSCRLVSHVPATHILGDSARIDQLLRNLIGNAIKYSPEGGAILVEITTASLPLGRRLHDIGDRPALCLAVMDEGIGIPENELEAIFEKFVQSSRTADGTGGTGLGLSICREITLAHRGIIRARNRAVGGAAFEVLLPLAIRDDP